MSVKARCGQPQSGLDFRKREQTQADAMAATARRARAPRHVATTAPELERDPRAERKKRRRERWQVQAGLRRHHLCSERVGACGHRRVSSEVLVRRSVRERDDGTTVQCAHFSGLLQCGSVWECPICAAKIRGERAAEVRQAAREWGHGTLYMLTLTVRHNMGNDLEQVRRGVADAYRRFIRGAAWERIAEAAGVEHWIRALEVTHGSNGWHPHLHVLWFCEVPLDEAERDELAQRMRHRWAECVVRELGQRARPNGHGVDLRPCHDADYIAKFALELVDPAAAKAAARGHRTPWAIAVGASQGDVRDGWLWQQYCRGIKGARMLTWSRGLKAFAGLEERDDQDLAEEEPDDASTVAVLPSGVWDAMRYRRHAACAVLEAAEAPTTSAEAHAAIQAIVDALEARARAAA